MTVRELLAKLNELPETLKDIPVLVETDEGGTGDLNSIRAQLGDAKIYWQPDAIVLSGNY